MLSRVILGSTAILATVAGAAVGLTPTAKAEDASQPGLPSDDELQLVQAQVVFRHGWRAPLSVSKTFGDEGSATASLSWDCPQEQLPKLKIKRHGEDYDLFNEDKQDSERSMGNCFLGQLTTTGHQQMRAVGMKLRERYVPQLLDLNHRWRYQIRASSTASRRTAETTYQVVQGLVHGSTDTQNDVVVDVNVVDPSEETMYPRGTCGRLRTQFRQLRSDPHKEELKQEAIEVLKEGKADSDYWKSKILASMCNTFSSMVANKLPLPGELTPGHVERICDISGKEYYNVYSRPHMSRLGIGRFLNLIKHRMHQRIAFERHGIEEDYIGVAHAHPMPKLYLYGGHDNTLGPLLVSLGVFDMKHPPMGSYMAFELYKKRVSTAEAETAPMFVKLHYNGKNIKLPGPCGNQEVCSAHNFFEMIRPQIPTHYEEECKEH